MTHEQMKQAAEAAASDWAHPPGYANALRDTIARHFAPLCDEAKDAEIAMLTAERDAVRKVVGADEGDVLAEMVQSVHDDRCRLADERDAVKNAAGFCNKHQPTGGHRNCLVCGCEALSRAISRIDYAIGTKNDMGVSLFDADYNEDRVATAVESLVIRLAAAEKVVEAARRLESSTADLTNIDRKPFHMRTVSKWAKVLNAIRDTRQALAAIDAAKEAKP